MPTRKINSHLIILYAIMVSVKITFSSEIKINWEKEFSNSVHCLIDIINNIKREILKMSIFGASKWPNMMTRLLYFIDIPVLIDCVEYPKESGLETRMQNDLIIILDSNIQVGDLLNQTLWHGDTRFIIVADDKWDEEIFQEFWDRKVVNVHALVRDDEEVILYSFISYMLSKCNIANPIIIDRWSNGTFLGNGISTIKDKIRITNVNRCPVNVTVVDLKPQVFFHDDCSCNGSHRISGIEGNIMKEIAKKLNMEVMYVIALDGIGWGWIKPKPHGVVGEVYTGRSDFGMGLLAPTIERFEHLDFSVPYGGSECITYGVHKGAGMKQPTWMMILVFEFEGIMWILIGLVFIILIFSFWFITTILKLPLFSKKSDLFMYLLGSCLGNPIRITNSGTFRIAIISWVIFTFVTTVAYKSSMGSKLSVPTPDPDINTFKELLQSGLQLTGYNNMLRLMQYNDSEPEIKLMAERFVVTNFNLDHAIEEIVKNKKISHVRHMTTFTYSSLINPRARGHIHCLTDCIYNYYPMFVLKKNSPFSRRTNQIIYRLREGGIVKFWRSKYIYELPKKPNTFKKLSLEHTVGMFFILILGHCLSVMQFIGECVYYRYRGSRKISDCGKKKQNLMNSQRKTKESTSFIRNFKMSRN